MQVTLSNSDWPRLKPLIDAAPLETIFLSSRIERFGLNSDQLGCPVIGVEQAGRLVAAAHCGANLVPIGDPTALGEVVEWLGPRDRTYSIMGPAATVSQFQQALVQRWGSSWAVARSIRAHQPLMAWQRSTPLPVAPDPRVRIVGPSDLEAYYRAAVSMYNEEVGGSLDESGGSYRAHIHYLISNHRSFGMIDQGRVWFKTDVGATYGSIGQIQGVWLDPELRGRGLSTGLIAATLWLIDPKYTTVSLYVNDYNTRARHIYDRLGFEQVGELATILY